MVNSKFGLLLTEQPGGWGATSGWTEGLKSEDLNPRHFYFFLFIFYFVFSFRFFFSKSLPVMNLLNVYAGLKDDYPAGDLTSLLPTMSKVQPPSLVDDDVAK